MTELECQSNQSPVIKSQKTELNQTIEELENTLRDKEEVCICVGKSIRLCSMPYMYSAKPINLFLCLPGNGKVERGIGKHE